MEKKEDHLREAVRKYASENILGYSESMAFINGAKSEAAKNYHQSEADREIERLKERIKLLQYQLENQEHYNELLVSELNDIKKEAKDGE